MSRKPGANVSVSNVQSEQDWSDLCGRQGGLTVVDIYSDWAGPCTAMSAALKKIKLEVGDDSLVYAMARSDSIPALEMFQGQCKPTYLFIASGQPVAVMHGANAPLMKTMVQDMMEVERRVQAGELERPTITLEEAVPVSELEEHEEDVTAAQASSSKMSWINDMKKEAQEKNEESSSGDAENEEDKEECKEADPEEVTAADNETDKNVNNEDGETAETTEAKNDPNNNDEN